MYYTVIKHDGHLRTRGKCRQHEPQASVFYVSRVFSNVRSVLSQCNTRLRLLHLLYIEVMWRKNNKTRFFYVFYSDKTRVFGQSERAYYPIYIINIYIYIYIYIYTYIYIYIYQKRRTTFIGWCEGEERSIPLEVERRQSEDNEAKISCRYCEFHAGVAIFRQLTGQIYYKHINKGDI